MNIKEIVENLNKAEKERLIKQGFTNSAFFDKSGNMTKEYQYKIIEGKVKYHKIDAGSSGAFMVEKETGEIYNIKSYGVPDKNKKVKANLGNVKDYDTYIKVKWLHKHRWNYLR